MSPIVKEFASRGAGECGGRGNASYCHTTTIPPPARQDKRIYATSVIASIDRSFAQTLEQHHCHVSCAFKCGNEEVARQGG